MRLYLAEADARFGRLTTEQEAVSETDNDMDLARSLPAVQTLTDGYRRASLMPGKPPSSTVSSVVKPPSVRAVSAAISSFSAAAAAKSPGFSPNAACSCMR